MFRQEALDRLSSPEELDQLMHITKPRSWIALCVIGALLAMAVVWAYTTTVTTSFDADGAITTVHGKNDIATIFVSLERARNLQKGMKAEVVLFGNESGARSVLVGHVAGVGDAPATIKRLEQVLGNQSLFRTEEDRGDVVPVTIDLHGVGKAKDGSLCSAKITLDEHNLIQLVLP
jgi:hypothetical protein